MSIELPPEAHRWPNIPPDARRAFEDDHFHAAVDTLSTAQAILQTMTDAGLMAHLPSEPEMADKFNRAATLIALIHQDISATLARLEAAGLA